MTDWIDITVAVICLFTIGVAGFGIGHVIGHADGKDRGISIGFERARQAYGKSVTEGSVRVCRENLIGWKDACLDRSLDYPAAEMEKALLAKESEQ